MKEIEEHKVHDDEIDLLQYVKDIWKRKWLITVFSVVFSILCVFYASFLSPEYESVSKWVPGNSGGSQANKLGGLAALAGINVGSSGSENYEAMYSELLTSPIILDSLIWRKWAINSDSVDSLDLKSILNIDESSLHIPVGYNYIEKKDLVRHILLGYLVSVVEYEKNTGHFSIKVTTEDPILSYGINVSLLAFLQKYAESDKTQKSKRDRKFIENRYKDFGKDLQKAEKKLTNFRERNPLITTPLQQLEMQRFLREVEIQNQLVIEFRKQLELAKVEEIKTLPDFIILQEPTLPISKSKPKKKIILLIGSILGFFIACFLALILGWWQENGKKIREELST